MAEPVLIKIAAVIAVVIVYGLLRWRLMVATHEFRLGAGCEADRLASDPRVGDEVRATLVSLADAVYRPAGPPGPSWTLLTIAMLLPLGVLRNVESPGDPQLAMRIIRSKLHLIFAVLTTSPPRLHPGDHRLGGRTPDSQLRERGHRHHLGGRPGLPCGRRPRLFAIRDSSAGFEMKGSGGASAKVEACSQSARTGIREL